VRDGALDEAALAAEHLSDSEVYAALRAEGVEFLSEVRYALLEPSGRISVLRDQNQREGMNIWTDTAAL
jgi:uncharacterized membrane protein YcaP (DUF421 family)